MNVYQNTPDTLQLDIFCSNNPVPSVESFKFLFTIISQLRKWEPNTNSIQKVPTVDVLSAEEGWPIIGATDQVLHCGHQVCRAQSASDTKQVSMTTYLVLLALL